MRMKVAEFLRDERSDEEGNCLHILEALFKKGYIRLKNSSSKYAVYARSEANNAFIFVCYTESWFFVSEREIDNIRSMCEEYEE